MMTATVRVGVKIERFDSVWVPFRCTMFHCRSKDEGDAKHCSISDWMADVVNLFPQLGMPPGAEKIPIGESRRYWIHMTARGWADYWGEYDEEVEFLKVRPTK